MSDATNRTSLHVYNARCALTVEPSRNRRGDVHTVNLESAARKPTGEEFDWDEKIVVQVTGAELPDVIAVLLGYIERVEFRFHGAARDKGYRLFHDADRLIVQLFAGQRERHTVTLTRADRLRIAVAAFRQLQRDHGGMSADVLHAMLSSVYTRDPLPAAPSPSSDGTAPPSAAVAAETVGAGEHGAPAETSDSGALVPDPDTARERDAYDW